MKQAIGAELKAKPDVNSITVDEFKIMVTGGKQNIVLIENNVIDLKEWEQYHPGGKFVLQKNLGRDITKYWYGGYQMVEHWRNKKHKHSYMATQIANSLIVAQLEGQLHMSPVLSSITETIEINPQVNCFKLTACDGQKTVDNWKHWYSDTTTFGRYFVVCRNNDTKVRRQYSVCNSVRPKY